MIYDENKFSRREFYALHLQCSTMDIIEKSVARKKFTSTFSRHENFEKIRYGYFFSSREKGEDVRFGSKWTLTLFLVTRIFCRKKPVLIKNQRKTLKSIANHYILYVFSRHEKKRRQNSRDENFAQVNELLLFIK